MTPSDNTFNADGTLVIGAGLAGLFCALKLAPHPVTVLSPKPLGFGASSAWAQGGVAAAIGQGDTSHAHARDTEMAGAGIVDHAIAEAVTAEAAARIDDLARWGTPFDRDDFGQYILGREAAHSANRIVKVQGDRAGWAIMQAVIAQVRCTPSIRVVEGLTALDLACDKGRIIGVYCQRSGNIYAEPIFVRAHATVLAAGGLGGLYAVTTNPPGVRGHAMGMAARAGATIGDPEFVQFHPTAIATGADPAPLATEALRGEGAILVNDMGERFMLGLHPDAELAPRDIVARANFRQIRSGRKVFLDTRKALGESILTRFPTVTRYCREAGIDPVTGMIPVTPAAHFHMGGVLVNECGRADLEGLWVCGEASCTGLHGANRLASNSLLEASVYGARIAEDISGLAPTPISAPFHDFEWLRAKEGTAEKTPPALKAVQDLRDAMTDLVGVERDADGLRQALRIIADMEANGQQGDRQFRNMTISATLVAAAALKRTESRGAHFRTDFPQTDTRWAHHTTMTLSEALAIRAEA